MPPRRTWGEMVWPPEAPLWLVISGNISLTMFACCFLLLIVPKRFLFKRFLRKARAKLVSSLRRMVFLSSQGPFFRLFAWCGRRCSCGYLASRCRPPQSVKVKATRLGEVMMFWSPQLPMNPFHEEFYVIEWGRVGASTWNEMAVRENGSKDQDRWKTTLSSLPEMTYIRVRVRALNRHGPSSWSDEVSVLTLVKPNDDGGFIGPLGSAGDLCKTQTYHWAQIRGDINLKIPIPEGCKGKDIKFKALPSRLEVSYLGSPPLPEPRPLLVGLLSKRITKADDVFWEIQTDDKIGRHIAVTLQKSEPTEKWASVMDDDNHPRVDLSYVRVFTGDESITDMTEMYE